MKYEQAVALAKQSQTYLAEYKAWIVALGTRPDMVAAIDSHITRNDAALKKLTAIASKHSVENVNSKLIQVVKDVVANWPNANTETHEFKSAVEQEIKAVVTDEINGEWQFVRIEKLTEYVRVDDGSGVVDMATWVNRLVEQTHYSYEGFAFDRKTDAMMFKLVYPKDI